MCLHGSLSMFALLSLVHTVLPTPPNTHIHTHLIYVKLGLVGPRGTLFVSFIHPINKKFSLMPEQQLAGDSQEWSPMLCMASKHNAVLKFSFCFITMAKECSFEVFFFLPQFIRACRPVSGNDRCCRDLKGSEANSLCGHYQGFDRINPIQWESSKQSPT